MNRRRHQVSEEEIQLFNGFRINNHNKELTKEQLCDLLRRMKLPTNGNFIKFLTSGVNPPVVRISRGKYMFAKEPVYAARLQTVWTEYTDYGNKDRVYVLGDKDTADNLKKIQDAIDLLKSNGFKVLKQVIKWEEA